MGPKEAEKAGSAAGEGGSGETAGQRRMGPQITPRERPLVDSLQGQGQSPFHMTTHPALGAPTIKRMSVWEQAWPTPSPPMVLTPVWGLFNMTWKAALG